MFGVSESEEESSEDEDSEDEAAARRFLLRVRFLAAGGFEGGGAMAYGVGGEGRGCREQQRDDILQRPGRRKSLKRALAILSCMSSGMKSLSSYP